MTRPSQSTTLSEAAVLAVVRERIENGFYASGVRMPAERALAAELGVTRGMIRNVYAQLTDLELIEQSHYHRAFVRFTPSHLRAETGEVDRAAALRTIAAILPSDPTFPGGLAVVAGIHKALGDTGGPYRLTFHDTYHKDRPQVLRLEAQAIRTAIDDGVSGIVLWYFSPEEVIVDKLKDYPDLPIVFIDRHPETVDSDFAGLDDVESSKAAVEYLLDLGHTRIAHLMDPGNFSTILERAEGYREAFASRGLPVPEDLVFHLDWSADESTVTNTEAAFDHLFSLDNPPTAVFTSNDYIAYRFLNIARSKGVRVPEDLSIVGHGNTDRYAQNAFLTSVDQPFETIGKAAAKLLLKRMSTKGRRHSFQHVILPTTLVERGSCRALKR